MCRTVRMCFSENKSRSVTLSSNLLSLFPDWLETKSKLLTTALGSRWTGSLPASLLPCSPLAHDQTTAALLLNLHHAKRGSATGPLPLLYSLPGARFPWSFSWLASSPPSSLDPNGASAEGSPSSSGPVSHCAVWPCGHCSHFLKLSYMVVCANEFLAVSLSWVPPPSGRCPFQCPLLLYLQILAT